MPDHSPSAIPPDAIQPEIRSTSIATTGPRGGSLAYWEYFAVRASSAVTRSSGASTTRPVPEARTHQRSRQSSS